VTGPRVNGWSKGTFKRACAMDLSLEPRAREATGYVAGEWGVCRGRRGWLLIHLPTGLSVPGGFDTLGAAKAFAEFMTVSTDCRVGRWGDLGKGKRAKAFVTAARMAYRVMHMELPRIVAIEGVEYGPRREAQP
jgi:hypothetical protein